MKKLFILLMGVLVATACNQSSKNAKDDDDTADSEVTVKKLSYTFEDDKIEVEIKVDYPSCDNEVLQGALRDFISEMMGGSYENDMADGQKVVDFYGDQIKNELIAEKKEQSQDMNEDDINGFYKKYDIKMEYQTDQFVTFIVLEDIYLNGAHGVEECYGQTFGKSDGRRFSTDMMQDLNSDGMHKIIKEGLRSYFGQFGDSDVSDDEELKTYILTEDDLDYLPMPKCAPYVTKEGVNFVYQPYEISFYAAGMPEFIVSLEDIKPYLKATAKKMLGLTAKADGDEDDSDEEDED